MHTTWISHVHLMVSHVHLMGITCTPHGYHMYTTWVSHVHLMDITCTPHGCQIHTPLVVHFYKIFHRGCMSFKWSGPIWAKSKTSVFATDGIWVTFSVVLNFLLLGWTPWMGFQNEQLMCFHNRQKRHGHSWACSYSNTIFKCDRRNRLFHFFSIRRILKIVLP